MVVVPVMPMVLRRGSAPTTCAGQVTASLLTLGGVALAASVSNAGGSEAKKKGRDCQKKATQRCTNRQGTRVS